MNIAFCTLFILLFFSILSLFFLSSLHERMYTVFRLLLSESVSVSHVFLQEIFYNFLHVNTDLILFKAKFHIQHTETFIDLRTKADEIPACSGVTYSNISLSSCSQCLFGIFIPRNHIQIPNFSASVLLQHAVIPGKRFIPTHKNAGVCEYAGTYY